MVSTAAAPEVAFTHREVLRILSGVLLCMLMAALDQTVLATALPAIAADFNGVPHLSWVITAYLLLSTGATLIFGKLSDLYGRRLLLEISIGVFLVASLACAMSQSMGSLIAARALQGHRRRRPLQHVASDHRRRGLGARARPLPGLYHQHLRRGQHRRALDRRVLRRIPDLALGVLDQLADRHPRLLPVPSRARPRDRAPPAPPDRLPRRGADHAGRDRADAGCRLGRQRAALDLAGDPGARRRSASSSSPPSRAASCARPRRCCRRGSSPARCSASRPSSTSSSPRSPSAPSCCCRCFCSSSSASTPNSPARC